MWGCRGRGKDIRRLIGSSMLMRHSRHRGAWGWSKVHPAAVVEVEVQRKTALKRGYGVDSARGARRAWALRQTLEAVPVVGWAVGEQERLGTRTAQVPTRLGVAMEGMLVVGMIVVGGILTILMVVVGKELEGEDKGEGKGRTVDDTDERAKKILLVMWRLADGGGGWGSMLQAVVV